MRLNTIGGSAWQRLIILDGSNAVESVFRPAMVSAADGPVSVVKEGCGTWMLEKAVSLAKAIAGTVAVREGTLRFENFAPLGESCSFGTSTQLNRPAYIDSVKDSDAIDYAVLFDGPAEKVGFLEPNYAGDAVVTNFDRRIGIESSGGFRSGRGRIYVEGVTAASSGEKLLVLDGEKNQNDTVLGVNDGVGRVSIEKRGSGVWTVKPPFGFSGRLSVKAGRLDLYNGGDRFTWFRLRIKENAFVSATYGETAEQWYTNKVGVINDGIKKVQQLGKWNLMDENGTVRNDLSAAIALNGASFSAQPTNTVVCCRPMEMATLGGLYLTGTRPLTALCYTGNNWYNQSTSTLLNVADESTWPTLVVRLADDVPEIKYCDFLSSLSFPSEYGGRVPTALRVDASCDGLAWTTVFDRNDLMPPKDNGKWYSGATAGGRATLSFSDASSRFALSPTKPAELPAIDVAATVEVASGATLRCRGAFNLTKIGLAEGGMGTIEGNVTLAAAGTLVTPDLAGDVFSKTFTTTLKDLPGAANLANWQVSCESAPGRYVMRYNPTNGSVTVMRRGTIVLFR